jgi:ketosteroid isomerase-like protein
MNQLDGQRVFSGMKIKRDLSFALLAVILLASPAWCQNSPIQQLTRTFLDAYAKGDRQAVLSLIDRENITVYGSDVAEVAHGSDAVLQTLALDQQLWGGSAHIGAMERISLIQNHSLASIFFDVPFSVGNRAPLSVRFAATWKREGKQWLLVQSSNVVPTEHQSAAELLHPPQSK